MSGNDNMCSMMRSSGVDGHPVAKVLHDGQRNVTDISSLVELMRGPEVSSIGRSDLLDARTAAEYRRGLSAGRPAAVATANKTPLTNGRLDIDKAFTGILDLKITAANMNGFVAASGPPFTADREEVEPFCWSDSPIRHLAHHGHPDVWDFDVEGVNWVWN